MDIQKSKYRWYLLGLILLTNIFCSAMPTMAMSVLSKEISHDLHLSVVQVGVVWGIGSLPAIITSLLGGAAGDKFGPKKMMVISSLVVGLLGASRGLVPDYGSLLVVVVLLGALTPFVVLNGIKMVGQWFPSHQLGLANGFLSMGMALGFFLGSILSASVLSPWLGGWRNVLMLYGVCGASLSILWLFTRSASTPASGQAQQITMSKSIGHVIRLKNVWVIGLVLFFMAGAIQGILGYLPLYLRGIGWEGVKADGALSAFHLISMVFVLPIALWSDRLGSRKKVMMIASIMIIIGIGMMSFAKGNLVYVSVLLAGFMRDGFMAMVYTSVMESRGVGPVYAGTASGFINGLSGIGMAVEPALGNSLAFYWAGAPFVLWTFSAMAAMGLVFLLKGKSQAS
ncbi:MAG: hypothetical protein C0410_02305 [Anaerolinea sp.]|nr:hypothetical protein [Anaerolinea sp.]